MRISILLITIGIGVIFWLLIRGFFYEGFINHKLDVSLDNASKIGDFIGGFVGVFFTLVGILLLYETLALQRKELTDSRKVFEKQQFENTFFSLLELYQSIVETLHYEDYSGTNAKGKEFFKTQKVNCFDSFAPSNSFYKNRKQAIDIYTKFYIEHKELIAHYFRTLYRIFRVIDTSKFSDSEKTFYSKIVRAQLSESELFMINYNACTAYGSKFRQLIVDYNLIKHLPVFERLEFKEWREKLTPEGINSLNQFFVEIIDYFKESIIHNEIRDFYKTYLKGKFALRVKNEESSITVKLYRNDSVNPSAHIQQGLGLDNFTNEELEQLIKCFLVEVFKNGNYEILNKSGNLKFKTDVIPDPRNENKFEIFGKVINTKGLKLNLK